MYKGTIIENSLLSKEILANPKLTIENHYTSGDWILNEVSLDESLIPQLSKSLKDGPWYIHVWKDGDDEIKVIFKNKIFDIKYSDKSTWIDAIKFGESIGIPNEQLDFPIK